jgi:hypothetical protein
LREGYKTALLAAGVDLDDAVHVDNQHRTIEHNEHIFSSSAPSSSSSPSDNHATSPSSSTSSPILLQSEQSNHTTAVNTPTKAHTDSSIYFPEISGPSPAAAVTVNTTKSTSPHHHKISIHTSNNISGTGEYDEDFEWDSDGNENGGENPERDDEREDEHDSSSNSSSANASDDSDEEIDVLDIGDSTSLTPSTTDILLSNVSSLYHRKEVSHSSLLYLQLVITMLFTLFLFSTKKNRNRGHKRLNEESWNDHFEELIRFQKDHNHFAVPTKGTTLSIYIMSKAFLSNDIMMMYVVGDFEKLYQWIKRQRAAKRNNKASLTPDRIKKLNDIGFPWQPDRKRCVYLFCMCLSLILVCLL